MVFWIVWLIIGIFFIVVFSVTMVPKIMLKTYAATLPVRVKTLERYSDRYGNVVVYSPAKQVRKYIKNYRIGTDEKGAYFIGEWAKPFAYAEYELTVYGEDNSIIEILRIKEKFNGGINTHRTRLPEGADYATLRVVCIDDNPIPAERRSFNLRYALWLAALCFCLSLSVDLLLWLGGTFVLRCLDQFSMTLSLPVNIWAEILGFAALFTAAITCAISLGRFFLRRRRESDD